MPLYKEYTIIFQMFVNPIAAAPQFKSLLHIGKGGNAGYGDRNPGVWIQSGKKLHLTSSIDGNVNSGGSYPIEENKWITVEVSQTLKDGKVILMESDKNYLGGGSSILRPLPAS